MALVALVMMAAGCAHPKTSEPLVVSPGQYPDAFTVAGDVVRDMGLAPELRSRRLGVIETEFVSSPSVLEPWTVDGSSLGRRWDNTVSHQRRRVRIEFEEAGAAATTDSERLNGPDVLGLDIEERDVAGSGDDLRMVVHVFVERSNQPGVRRSTWSRRLTSRTLITPPGADRALPRIFWTPVARDAEMEHRITAEIQRRLAQPETPPPA